MSNRDRGEARRRRDEAIAKGYDAADESWRKNLDVAIHHLATTLGEFTTDDIWEWFEASGLNVPRETRSVGGAMRRAEGNGWIRPTNRVLNSDLPICHSRPKRVWQSRIVEV